MKKLEKTNYEKHTEKKELEKERNKPSLLLYREDGGLVSMDGLESTRTTHEDYSIEKELSDDED